MVAASFLKAHRRGPIEREEKRCRNPSRVTRRPVPVLTRASPISRPDRRPRVEPIPSWCPRQCTLDGFLDEVSQAEGISLIDVDVLSTLVVRTENSVYHITVLRPHVREVLVQGGTFFTVRTRACLNGSSSAGVA